MRVPTDPIDGVSGQLFSIHGGKFYEVRAYKGAPAKLPSTLHWFKWEAYFTWITGFCLLTVVYYLNPDLYLINKSVADLTHWQAILISLASLIGGWLAYDYLCRFLHRFPVLVASIGFIGMTIVAYGLCQVFGSRAAYIHVGAMLGTMMAANVFFVIIPGQRKMVDAMLAQQEPDISKGAQGALRSLHNNYLTLPVLFIMISNHFPMTYGHSANWAILAAISILGAMVRHYFNLKHQGQHKQWVLPVATAGMVALAFVTSPSPSAIDPDAEPVSYAEMYTVLSMRCIPCHTAKPTFPGVHVPPKGIVYDSPQQIQSMVARIAKVAVYSRTMPLANATNMTEEERDILERWILQGAKIPKNDVEGDSDSDASPEPDDLDEDESDAP